MLHLTRSFRIVNNNLIQAPMAEEKQPAAAPAAEPEEGKDAKDRARAWCFTFNNYQNFQDYERKMRDEFNSDFVLYGKEVGDSGTPHLQGFIYAKNKLRFSTIKERFDRLAPGSGVHIEKARTTKAAILYCKKGAGTPSAPIEADVVQWGAEPGQGARNDLELVANAIAEGASRKRLAEEFPTMVIKYNKGLEALLAMQRQPYAEEKEIIWCCGPSGSGKTMWARNYLTEKYGDYYEKSNPTKWWDQYDGDEAVLLDEFRDMRGDGNITFRDLLTILGTGRKYVEIKGGTVPLCAKTIVITSCMMPLEVFADNESVAGEEMVQLTRRINRIYKFKQVEQNLPREPEVLEIEGYRPDLPKDKQYKVIRQSKLTFDKTTKGKKNKAAVAAMAIADAGAAVEPTPAPRPLFIAPPVLPEYTFLRDEGEPVSPPPETWGAYVPATATTRGRFVIPRADSGEQPPSVAATASSSMLVEDDDDMSAPNMGATTRKKRDAARAAELREAEEVDELFKDIDGNWFE